MAALATIDDLEARLSAPIPAEAEARALALLDDASASIRSATGQTITAGEAVERYRVPNGRRIRLTQGRLVSATGVDSWPGGDPIGFTADGFQGIIVEASTSVAVTVTYQHAYTADQTAAIAGLVATLAARAYGVTAESAGLTSESVGGYSYQIGGAGSGGGFGLTKAESRRARRILGLSGMRSIRTGY